MENFLPPEDSLKFLVVKELPTVMGVGFPVAMRVWGSSHLTLYTFPPAWTL
jgi:hypothetical protein